MAIRYSDECCNCDSSGYPCVSNNCNLRHCKILICDLCGVEEDRLYKYDDLELCGDCVLERLEVIE